MRLKVDEEADALYLRLDEAAIVESEEVKPGVVLDFDAKNRIVGIEFLDVTKKLGPEALRSFLFETKRA